MEKTKQYNSCAEQRNEIWEMLLTKRKEILDLKKEIEELKAIRSSYLDLAKEFSELKRENESLRSFIVRIDEHLPYGELKAAITQMIGCK